ncbi:MAG: hypothetical protein IPL56_09220 [Saprospiraceae bacterium]|nr:hypothetical protein [Saprospiraceae bacterium]
MDYKRIVYESIYYRLETKPEKLERINAEVLAVCAFSDWNPIYYLDVSERCFRDVTGSRLGRREFAQNYCKPRQTITGRKSILPSYNEQCERIGWVNGVNNWNASRE